jgi:hypothetical protein
MAGEAAEEVIESVIALVLAEASIVPMFQLPDAVIVPAEPASSKTAVS